MLDNRYEIFLKISDIVFYTRDTYQNLEALQMLNGNLKKTDHLNEIEKKLYSFLYYKILDNTIFLYQNKEFFSLNKLDNLNLFKDLLEELIFLLGEDNINILRNIYIINLLITSNSINTTNLLDTYLICLEEKEVFSRPKQFSEIKNQQIIDYIMDDLRDYLYKYYFHLQNLLRCFNFRRELEYYRSTYTNNRNQYFFDDNIQKNEDLLSILKNIDGKNKIEQENYDFYFCNNNLYIHLKLKNKRYGYTFIEALFKDLNLIKVRKDIYKIENIQLEENKTLFGECKVNVLMNIGEKLSKEFIFKKFQENDFKRTSKGWIFLGTDSLYKRIKVLDQTLFFDKYYQILKLDSSKLFKIGEDYISFDDILEKQKIEEIYEEIYNHEK